MIRPTTSNKQLRDAQRLVHLAAGLFLAAYLYSPLAASAAFGAVVRFGVVPVLVGTGLAMWQLPRLRRWLKSGRSRPNRPETREPASI